MVVRIEIAFRRRFRYTWWVQMLVILTVYTHIERVVWRKLCNPGKDPEEAQEGEDKVVRGLNFHYCMQHVRVSMFP